MTTPVLEVKDLRVHFFLDEGVVRAVDGVSFDVRPGQVVGIVGESGCGKSVTMKAILQIVEPPGRIVAGQILFRQDAAPAVDLARLSPKGTAMRAPSTRSAIRSPRRSGSTSASGEGPDRGSPGAKRAG